MKKFGAAVFIGITVLLVGLMIGILIGRFGGGAGVQLSKYDRQIEETKQQSDDSADISTGRININTATAEQLTMLPGIGETYAKRIIDYRNENGMFTSINDLCNITGIGEKKLEAIEQYITVGGQS